jgi:hypothetical protein
MITHGERTKQAMLYAGTVALIGTMALATAVQPARQSDDTVAFAISSGNGLTLIARNDAAAATTTANTLICKVVFSSAVANFGYGCARLRAKTAGVTPKR